MKKIFGIGVKVLGLSMAVALSGCGSPEQSGPEESTSPTSAEEAQVAEYLRATGTVDFEFDHEQGYVTLEGDILVPFSELLEQSRAFDPQELVEKGRWYLFPSHGIYSGRVTMWPINLEFDANVPEAWRNIFTAAARQWDASTECVAYGANALNKTTIHYKNLGSEKFGKYAQAPYPSTTKGGTRAGHFVDINTTYGCPSNCGLINGLSTTLMMQVALHELGHTLGFQHRGEGNLIPGTSSTAPSVMVANFGEPGLRSPTDDDRRSLNVAYKKNGHPLHPSCSNSTFQ